MRGSLARSSNIRLPDWPDRLIAAIESHLAHPFAWGAYDCGTLFRDCVIAVYGEDPGGGFSWSSRREAAEFLVRNRCRSMLEFCETKFDEIVPADARRGDLAFPASVVPLMCPHIVTGAEAFSRDQAGLSILPRELFARAFKVG